MLWNLFSKHILDPHLTAYINQQLRNVRDDPDIVQLYCLHFHLISFRINIFLYANEELELMILPSKYSFRSLISVRMLCKPNKPLAADPEEPGIRHWVILQKTFKTLSSSLIWWLLRYHSSQSYNICGRATVSPIGRWSLDSILQLYIQALLT